MTDSTEERPSTTLPGTVEKSLNHLTCANLKKPRLPSRSDHLYREIRIDNALTNQNGEEIRLKESTQVEVTIEADPKGVVQPNADSEAEQLKR
jgi:hypothetical protein